MSKRGKEGRYVLAHFVKTLSHCWISAYMQTVKGANTSITEDRQKAGNPAVKPGKPNRKNLTLGELEALTGFLLTVFLTFFHTRVAGEVTGGFKRVAVGGIHF